MLKKLQEFYGRERLTVETNLTDVEHKDALEARAVDSYQPLKE